MPFSSEKAAEPGETEVTPAEDTSEETVADETAENDPAAEEGVYETLRITDAKAEITERDQKIPETDEERDMLF